MRTGPQTWEQIWSCHVLAWPSAIIMKMVFLFSFLKTSLNFLCDTTKNRIFNTNIKFVNQTNSRRWIRKFWAKSWPIATCWFLLIDPNDQCVFLYFSSLITAFIAELAGWLGPLCCACAVHIHSREIKLSFKFYSGHQLLDINNNEKRRKKKKRKHTHSVWYSLEEPALRNRMLSKHRACIRYLYSESKSLEPCSNESIEISLMASTGILFDANRRVAVSYGMKTKLCVKRNCLLRDGGDKIGFRQHSEMVTFARRILHVNRLSRWESNEIDQTLHPTSTPILSWANLFISFRFVLFCFFFIYFISPQMLESMSCAVWKL